MRSLRRSLFHSRFHGNMAELGFTGFEGYLSRNKKKKTKVSPIILTRSKRSDSKYWFRSQISESRFRILILNSTSPFYTVYMLLELIHNHINIKEVKRNESKICNCNTASFGDDIRDNRIFSLCSSSLAKPTNDSSRSQCSQWDHFLLRCHAKRSSSRIRCP